MAIQMSIIKIPGAVKVAARDSPRRLSPAVLPKPPVRGMARPLAPVSSRAEAPFRPTVPGDILSFHGRIALPKGRSCLKGCPLPSGSSRSRGGRPATSPLVCDIRPGESRDRNEYGPNGRRPGTPFRSRAPLPRFPVAVFPVQSLRPRSFAPQPAFRSPFSQYNRCDLDPSRRCPAFRSPFFQYNRCNLDPSRRCPAFRSPFFLRSGRRFGGLSTILLYLVDVCPVAMLQ